MKIISFVLYLTVVIISANGQRLDDIVSDHFPPRAREVSLSPLSSIIEMNHHNVTSILTTLLEAYQRITAYKNILASTRLSTTIPSPHPHCFIMERDLSNFSPASAAQNLACDVPLINLLSLALQRMEQYERKCFFEDGYHLDIFHTNKAIKSIVSALANITSVRNIGSEYGKCGLPCPSDVPPYQQKCQVSSSQGAPEDRSRRSRLRGQSTTQSSQLPPTTMIIRPIDANPTSEPPRSPDIDPTDISFFRDLQRKRRSTSNRFGFLEETPTAATTTTMPTRCRRAATTTTPTRCRTLDSVESLFVYTYEVWLGLYYVQLDLSQKRKCLE